MYKYKVTAEYVKTGKLALRAFHETEFILHEGNKGLARAIIQNTLLDAKLRKELKDYHKWRTCEVSEPIEVKEGEADSDKDFEALAVEAINMGVVPFSINSYESPKDKKKILEKEVENKKKAKKEATKKSKIKLEDID